MANILVVDDDPAFNKMLSGFLARSGMDVQSAHSAKSAINELGKNSCDLVLVDYKLPDIDGLTLITKIKKKKPRVPVILMTSYQDIRTAVRSIQLGAYEFVTKPLNSDELLSLVKRALEIETQSNHTLKSYNSQQGFIWGTTEVDEELMQRIELVAPTKMSVLILGESGTGKEFTARLVHAKSKRAQAPFYAIDCGALSSNLAASELFGHKKGAFTGALEDKPGAFMMANGGTLFLDEVGNLDYDVQVQLLRVVQERTVRAVGSGEEEPIDVRIIAATNERLSASNQDFRSDLFHRLNEFTLQLQPLRNRKADIKGFCNHFIKLSASELDINEPDITQEAVELLVAYQWPGNLRELRNAIRGAVLLSLGKTIDVRHLPYEIQSKEVANHVIGTESDPQTEHDLKRLQEETERELIIRVLKETKYNKSKTAEELNIDRKTLYRKLKKYAIDH